mmetsp:Transcript_3515/g.4720  ORF Transcript_3515/g.4720 Transcript_3515/m.4720 type:complete len:170 (+) Transcript_3515:102-611(+)
MYRTTRDPKLAPLTWERGFFDSKVASGTWNGSECHTPSASADAQQHSLVQEGVSPDYFAILESAAAIRAKVCGCQVASPTRPQPHSDAPTGTNRFSPSAQDRSARDASLGFAAAAAATFASPVPVKAKLDTKMAELARRKNTNEELRRKLADLATDLEQAGVIKFGSVS